MVKFNKERKIFIVDSFPVKAYENHKRFRARIFSGKEFHGYTATRKQYFFGLKVHMVVDTDGVPIEFAFTPASTADVKALQNFTLDLPEETVLMGDKAYTSYDLEDFLLETQKIKLLPKRRTNLKRQNTQEENFSLSIHRNRLETVFSLITSRLPRYIKVRTEKGFALKLLFSIIGYMVHLYCPSV